MRSLLEGRGSLIPKLLLLSLMLLGILPSGCVQGGIVEGEVHYKYVSGMEDRRYTIIVLNEPTDETPSIRVGEQVREKETIQNLFPSSGNLVIDSAAEMQIEALYEDLYYVVSIHVMSGNEYKYYQACRTEREMFNELQVGTKVKVETEASDIGPRILRIVE